MAQIDVVSHRHFSHEFEGQVVRTTIDSKAQTWFCGADVCGILQYTNPSKAIADHCKTDGITKRYTIDSLERPQEALFISEPNLYRLITKSQLPAAERFERWVFEEVLPSLRKSGKYSVPTAERPLPPVIPAPTIPVEKYIALLEDQNHLLRTVSGIPALVPVKKTSRARRGHFQPAEREQIEQMFNAGMPNEDIAVRMRCSESTIRSLRSSRRNLNHTEQISMLQKDGALCVPSNQ